MVDVTGLRTSPRHAKGQGNHATTIMFGYVKVRLKLMPQRHKIAGPKKKMVAWLVHRTYLVALFFCIILVRKIR